MNAEATHPNNWRPNLNRFLSARFLGHLAYQIQLVAVGWQVYDLTGRAVDLGIVGLVQFLPIFFFSLPAGQVADLFSRKVIVLVGMSVGCLCAIALLLLSHSSNPSVYGIYAVLFVQATMRAFTGPANQSLLPDLVPKGEFTRVVAWNSSLWQIAITVGPLVGGFIYSGFGNAQAAYAAVSVSLVLGIFFQSTLSVPNKSKRTPATLQTLLAGLHYVYKNKSLLGAISLDLFAVLLGGAVALLPAIAKDV